MNVEAYHLKILTKSGKDFFQRRIFQDKPSAALHFSHILLRIVGDTLKMSISNFTSDKLSS